MKGKQNKKMEGKAKRQITGDWSQRGRRGRRGRSKKKEEQKRSSAEQNVGTKKRQCGTKCRNKKKAGRNKIRNIARNIARNKNDLDRYLYVKYKVFEQKHPCGNTP